MLLSSKFKGSKCKTQLKLCVGRIKLLRNKRALTVKELRKGIAELLRTNQEAAATIRVEHVFREEAMMDAYDALELFCEQVSVRMQMIEASRECPPDLKEAISSLIFAAPRCPDLPELMQVRSLFASKYGKEFVAAASELMANCEVNRQLIGKLSTHPPSGQFKVDLLKKIAEEYDVGWDPEKLQKSLCGADPDLLKGAQSFLSPFAPPTQGGSPVTADSRGGDVTEVGRAATESGTAATGPRRSERGSIFAASFVSKPGQQKTGSSPQVNPAGIQVSPPAPQGYFPSSQVFPPGQEGFSSGLALYPPDSVLSTPSPRSFGDPQQGASASQPFSPHHLEGSVQEKASATGSATRSPITSFVSPVILAPDSMKTVAAETVVGVYRPNVTQRNPIVPFPSPVLPSGRGTDRTPTSEPKSSNSHLDEFLRMGERPRGFEQHGEDSRSEVSKQEAAAGDPTSGTCWNDGVGWMEGWPPVLEFYREEGRVKALERMRGQDGSGTGRAAMLQHRGKEDHRVKKESSGQRSESMDDNGKESRQQSESVDDNGDEWRRLLLSKAREWSREKKAGREDGESSDEDYADVAAAAAAAVTAAERAASAARAAARLAIRLGEQSMQEKSTDGRGSERQVVYEEAMSVAPETTEVRRSAGQASSHARDYGHLDQADERSKGRTEARGRMRHREEHLVMEYLGQDEVAIDQGTGSSGQHACSQEQQPGNELGGEQAIFRQAGWQTRSSRSLVEGTKDEDARAGRGLSPTSHNPTTTRSGLDMSKSVDQDEMPDDSDELSRRIMRQPSPERASGAGIGTENYPPSSVPLYFASPQSEGHERVASVSVRTKPTSPYAAIAQPPRGSQEGLDEDILKMFTHGSGKNIARAQQPTDQGRQKTETQQSDDAGKEMAESQRPTFRLTHSWDDDDDDDDDNDGRPGRGNVSATRKKNAEDASEGFDDLDFPSPPTAPVIFKPS